MYPMVVVLLKTVSFLIHMLTVALELIGMGRDERVGRGEGGGRSQNGPRGMGNEVVAFNFKGCAYLSSSYEWTNGGYVL